MEFELFLELINERLAELRMAPKAAEAAAGLPPDAIRNVLRGGKAGPTFSRIDDICRALDLEFYIGPRRQREPVSGFAEAAVARIEPAIDGNVSAFRQGFLPVPFSRDDPRHRGVAPVALARSWMDAMGLVPDNLSFIAMPDDDMEPAVPAGELLLVDGAYRLDADLCLSALVCGGRLRVGWAVRPERDAVVVLFERRFADPIVLRDTSTALFRYVGRVVARFDGQPRPWLDERERHAALIRAREMLSK